MAERKINLDDRKYDALKRVLAAQGKDVDEEIIAQIEKLYEDLVPEYERGRQFPEGSFAVYGLKDQGETLYFTSSKIMTLYGSALCYRDLDSYGKDFTLDSAVYMYFGEVGTDFIREDLFAVLIKAMANDERITVAAVYNMDSETVKVYDRDGVTVRHYTMDSFMDALESAELTPVQNGAEREKTLEQLLTGREYLTEPLLPMGYYAAKLTVCKAASDVLETCLDHVDCKYTDPLSDCLYDTKKGLSAIVDQLSMQDADEIRPYLKEQLEHYTDQLWADGYLEYYGWDRTALAKAIVCTIEEKNLRDFAYSYIVEDTPQEGGEHTDESYEITM